MQRSYQSVLLAGFGIMGIALLLEAVNAAWPLLYFVVFFPGFILGRLLIHNKDTGIGKKVLFLFISGLSYILCFWITDVTRENDKLLGSLKLIGASCLGAVILSASYLLISKVIKPITFIALSLFLVGFLSAVPGAIFMYLFKTIDPYPNGFSNDFNWVQFGLIAGIFLIYPLWQFSFVWCTNMQIFNKTVDNLVPI